MNRHHPELTVLQGLLSLLVENAIDTHQWELLERMLENSPAARRLYFEYLDLHAELESSPTPPTAATFRPPMRRPLHTAHRPWLRYAAAVLIVAGIGLGASLLLRSTRANKSARPTEVFATITDVRHAQFDASDLPTEAGSPLHGGFLRLKSGEVDVEFASGAQVTLRGPSVFGINSAMRGFLRSGELHATVPHTAKGFTIGAPGLAVVDLGTEFHIDVDPEGRSAIRVLSGQIEVHLDGADGAAGQSIRLDHRRGVRVDAVTRRVEPLPALSSEVVEVPADRGSCVVDTTGQLLMPLKGGKIWARVGQVGADAKLSAMLCFFELPTLKPGQSLAWAELELPLIVVKPRTTFGLGLFSLGVRDQAVRVGGDFEPGGASSGVLIRGNVVEPSTPPGAVRIGSPATPKLLETLQGCYRSDGTPAARYAVFRLNAPSPSTGLPLTGYHFAAPVLRLKIVEGGAGAALPERVAS